MKDKIYKTGCFLAWICILSAFVFSVKNVSLLGIGFLIFGATFLYNFYVNDIKSDLIHGWWQDVYAYFCLLIGSYYQFGFAKYKLGTLLTISFIVGIILKYRYTKKKLGELNQGPPRFPFTNMN